MKVDARDMRIDQAIGHRQELVLRFAQHNAGSGKLCQNHEIARLRRQTLDIRLRCTEDKRRAEGHFSGRACVEAFNRQESEHRVNRIPLLSLPSECWG